LLHGHHLGRRDGVPGIPTQIRPLPTAVQGTDGRLWFAAGAGVAWLDPSRAEQNVPEPPIAIATISADDTRHATVFPMSFPPRTSSVQIAYSAVSLSDPEAIRFRYRLQETDTAWHEVAAASPVTYRNLAPGAYHFIVGASDTNGKWSANVATAEFTILPAFYQTGWFRVLIVAAFFALLLVLHQLRLRQLAAQFNIRLEERVNERTRIARELHDTLLQSFHGLMFRFQAAANMLPDRPVDAKQKFESAIDQAAQAITEGRDAVQNLRASTVVTNDLAEAISALGAELAAAHNQHTKTPPTVDAAVEGTPRNLHPIVRDDIYRIVGEALRNAFRHAGARRIEVMIRYGNEQLQVRVRDDGKGIDPAVVDDGRPGHFGIPGMRERAGLVGGHLEVWSRAGLGTEMELTIPAADAYATPRGRGLSWWFARRTRTSS
jgi:signal transduction histidine kinase